MIKQVVAGTVVWLSSMLLMSISTAIADVQLNEVVVTATKTERKPQDVTQSVTVITADQIDKSGASNVAEAINKTAGVMVTDQGPLGSLQAVTIRGSSYQQVLVLLDGKRLNSASAGGYDLSELPVPLDAIERIEIVRGPGSALYGSDAVGGVVNIITKKPSKPVTILSGAVGERNYASDSIYHSGRDGNTYYALSYGKEHSGGYSFTSDAGDTINHNNADQYNVGMKLGYDIDATSSIEATSDYIEKWIGVSGSRMFPSPNANQTNRDTVTGMQYKQRLSKTVDFNIRVYQSDERLHFENPDVSVYTSDRSMTSGSEAQVNWIMNSFSVVTIGAEGRYDSMVDSSAGTHMARISSAYIQDEMSMGDSFILVLGGRNDVHSSFGSEWSPKASARYLYAGSGTILRASYGKSFRAPTLNDLYFTDSYGDIGNPNLQPEHAEEYEGGIEQSLGTGNSLKFTAFNRRISDLIIWQPLPSNPFAFTPKNLGRARVTGTETELHFVASQYFSGNLSYTQMFPVNLITGERLFSDVSHIPAEQFGGTLFVALDQQTTLSLDGKSVRNYVEPGQPNMEQFKQYYTLDGKITDTVVSRKDFKAQVFIGMKNIFDRKYETVLGYPMPPQTFYGGMTASF